MKVLLKSLKVTHFIVLLLMLTSCGGVIDFSFSSLDGGSVSSAFSFSPQMSLSSMDDDTVKTANHLRTLMKDTLMAEGTISAAEADAIIAKYSLDEILAAEEDILAGEFVKPEDGGASAIVSALVSGVENFEATLPRETEFLNLDVTMEDGTTYKVHELLVKHNDLVEEVKLNVANANGYLISNEQFDNLVLYRARREFLYVFVNSLMAQGSDLIGVMQYLGIEYDSSNETGAVKANIDDVNAGINANKYEIRPVRSETQESTYGFLDENKSDVYIFIEKFISLGVILSRDPFIVTYSIDSRNFCKFAVQDDSQACIDAAEERLSTLSFLHTLDGQKSLRIVYDQDNIPSPIDLFNIKYDITFRGGLELNLENVKQAALSVMRKERELDPTAADSSNITEDNINFLNRISVAGDVEIGAGVTDLVAGDNISDSDLPAKLYGQINNDVNIYLPEDLSQADIDTIYGPDSGFTPSDEGAVSFHIGQSSDTVKLEHIRGNSLYEDLIGINVSTINFVFPPFTLDASDFFIFDLALDEVSDTVRVTKNSGESQVVITEDSILKNFVSLDNFSIEGVIVEDEVDTGTSTINNITMSPFNLHTKYQVEDLPLSVQTSLVEDQGMSLTDYADITVTSPNGNFFALEDMCYTVRSGVIDPLYLDAELGMAGNTLLVTNQDITTLDPCLTESFNAAISNATPAP